MCAVIRSVVAFNCPNDHRGEDCIIDALSSRLCPIILARDIAQCSSALVGTATLASSWTSINVVQSARRISIKFHAGVPARPESKLSNSVYVRVNYSVLPATLHSRVAIVSRINFSKYATDREIRKISFFKYL